ncbi:MULTISPECIES: hypothetical protein [unclassified Endozoicomonas]|uniref:hypothetical protein n=1 Tax=unclassified Endozoicomonas TaxID=2644528 RepID=UPI003BB05E5F
MTYGESQTTSTAAATVFQPQQGGAQDSDTKTVAVPSIPRVGQLSQAGTSLAARKAMLSEAETGMYSSASTEEAIASGESLSEACFARTTDNDRSLPSAFSVLPLAKAVPSWEDFLPPEGTFDQVDSGFQWLRDQNARLQPFFNSGGGLDCLANPEKLSMTPEGLKLLAETSDNVNRLLHGAHTMLYGYQLFLSLAGNNGSGVVNSLRAELPQLVSRFETLKQTIRSGLESVRHALYDVEEGRMYCSDWVDACHQLHFCLQSVNPTEPEQVQSVRALIFVLQLCSIKIKALIDYSALGSEW